MVSRRNAYLDGRSALDQVDQRIGAVRAALTDALEEVESAETREVEVRQEQAKAYGELADIRLDIVAAGISLDDLQGAEREARELLDQHEFYVEDQQTKVEQSAEALAALETERSDAARLLDETVEAYEVRVQDVETELKSDETYLALAETLEEASAVVARSEQKLELAKEDRKQKGAPYDGDPLFSYLWRRGFRTTEYKGGGLTKILDNWVARIIKFDRARLNYARLTELPLRLEEHVERVTQDQITAQANLDKAEQTALTQAGVTDLESKVTNSRNLLADFDKKIEAAEDRHAKLISEHELVLSGGRGPAAKARQILEEALRKASFPDLRLLAAETIELHDDRIVDRLVKLRAEQMSFDLDNNDLRRRPTRLKKDLRSLETLRSEFKRARYDSPYASFKSSVLDRVLSGVVSGQIDIGRALQMLRTGLVQRQPKTPRGFGGNRRNDALGLPDGVGDVLLEVLKQSGKGGWGGGGRARPIKRRSPKIKPRSRRGRSGKKKGRGFKSTGGF